MPECENSEDIENCNEKRLKCQLCSAEFADHNIMKTHFESFHDVKFLKFIQVKNLVHANSARNCNKFFTVRLKESKCT